MCGGMRRPGSSGCSTTENAPPVISAGILKSTPTPPSHTDSPSPASTTIVRSVVLIALSFRFTSVSTDSLRYKIIYTDVKRMSTPRTYELKRRAERRDETRRRIVAAAVALHAELGPARTTVKAIAQRAGV